MTSKTERDSEHDGHLGKGTQQKEAHTGRPGADPARLRNSGAAPGYFPVGDGG